jgi:hypothetical protein
LVEIHRERAQRDSGLTEGDTPRVRRTRRQNRIYGLAIPIRGKATI